MSWSWVVCHLPRHRYELFFVPPHCRYDLISLVPTWLYISTSCFWNRSPIRRRPMPFWTRPGLILGTSISASTRPSWRHSYIAMSCGNNARVEGLNVTLDDLAGCTRTDLGEWSDVSAWFIIGWILSWTARASKSIVRSWERFPN